MYDTMSLKKFMLILLCCCWEMKIILINLLDKSIYMAYEVS